jgi:nitroimidazol reductase NimA-like FMN-containing flavoprotein (pyridoxamine 5'-phosphate oxidase superfamily)
MTTAPATNRHIEELDPATCRALLATCSLGRVGLSVDALPVVLPVNYALDGDAIVFRTVRGTKLDAAHRHQVVAFEVDQVDPATGAGWSVLVRGMTAEITDRAELRAAAALDIHPWASPEAERVVRVDLSVVTGRRVHAAA